MPYVLRCDSGVWHVSSSERGAYLRIGVGVTGLTVSNRMAREIARAILEATDEYADAN